MMALTAPAPVRVAPSKPAKPVRLWLWAPLTPLFWLLSPFALLLAPFVWIALPRRPRNPFIAAFALGGVLVSLSGTVIEIQAPDARLSIRIF
jgi:hypothetical protein